MNTNLEIASTDGEAHVPVTDDLPDEALVNVAYVRARAGNPSNPTLWRWIDHGDFPRPERRTGPAKNGSRLWRLGVFRKWLRGEWTPEHEADADGSVDRQKTDASAPSFDATAA